MLLYSKHSDNFMANLSVKIVGIQSGDVKVSGEDHSWYSVSISAQ